MSLKDILNENNEKENSKKCEIKGFILDIDGTLLNSKQQHLEAWKRTLEKHGIKKSEEEIIAHFGKSTLRIAQELVADKDDDNSMLYKQIADEKTKTFYELIPNIKLFEGVQETLEKIHDMGYKIAFASSNYDFILEVFMKTFGWGSISVGFVGIDSITHAKPHPEMI
ncbi:MAG: HAD family hydrolase, partial [Promethearchaeota archaeon]